MRISQLVAGMASPIINEDFLVTGLCSDSRDVKLGNCFFALKGKSYDGRDYIADAIEQGASAIFIDTATPYSQALTVPLITVTNLANRLGEIAARFYQYPSSKLTMIGITGTNGKTSTSQFIATALNRVSKRCGVIGTLGYGFPEQLLPSTHTTCNALILQRQIADIFDQGAEAIAMEVSSHALDQERIAGVSFDIGIFTNLTRDHLDYHGTMENYAAAKRKLFYAKDLKYAVINTDDPFGLTLAKELKDSLEIYCYGLSENKNNLGLPTINAHHINLNHKGVTAKISSPWGDGQFRSRLLGRFNISNLLAVFACLQLMNIPMEQSLECIANLHTVTGRMQMFGGGKQPLVVVDYAHTPDALMQVLLALREHTNGTLWCIFGCGGDRDRGKRPLMGQIAERYADQLVITDDNPRTEDPQQIVLDIRNGLLCPWAVEIEHDRGAAIAHVISCAQPGDVVLVAGKGHENYQLIGQERLAFSDSEHIQTQLKLPTKNGN